MPFIEADDKVKNDDIDGARNVLIQFIQGCTSPFHKTHAINQLTYYNGISQ